MNEVRPADRDLARRTSLRTGIMQAYKQAEYQKPILKTCTSVRFQDRFFFSTVTTFSHVMHVREKTNGAENNA